MSFRFLMYGCALGALSLAISAPSATAADETGGDAGHSVSAEADPAEHTGDGHGDGEHGEAGHGSGEHGAGAHHDPFEDALHGNAGPNLEAPEEWKHSLAIWTLVVFGLLMSLLWKFAWGPIRDALDSREQSIQANIDGAAEQNAKASALLAEHEAKLASTADEVRQILDNARKEAETQKAGILAEAQAAAESEKNRALQEIAAAKNGAIQELAERSVDAAVGMAGSIVKRELQSGDHSSLISEALQHFPSKN